MTTALRYLLDTNVLSEAMRPIPDAAVLRRLTDADDTVATAAPAWHELRFGRDRLPPGRRRRAIDEMLRLLEDALVVLPYDKSAASWHARERARRVKRGRPPSFVDGQIAAIAAVNDLTLVTRNLRDFAAFGVSMESWFTD